MSDLYTYIFVRSDIAPVHQTIQVGHACIMMMALCNPPLEAVKSNIVLIHVENERELIDVSKALETSPEGVAFSMFFEPDRDMGYSALCTVPVKGADREFFFRWQLKPEEVSAG